MENQPENSDAQARRLANLKPFQPGQSGNPKGRPRDIVTQAYRRLLAKADPSDPENRAYAETLAEQMIIKAKGGDVRAMKEITDRVQGKAAQLIEISSERRDQLEHMVQTMVDDAAANGAECSREEAINVLSIFTPEVSALLN
jgi:Family of unknown function (DUF5681)